MKIFEELKNKIDNLESKYEDFREGIDYTVSVDKEGKKSYDIHSEKLRKSIFGNFREEGVINPYLQRGLESNAQSRQIPPANTPNTPFWNAVWGKSNELELGSKDNLLEESDSSKIKELEGTGGSEIPKETSSESSQINSGDSRQTEVSQQTEYQKWLEKGKSGGWLTIAIVVPTLFSLFFTKP